MQLLDNSYARIRAPTCATPGRFPVAPTQGYRAAAFAADQFLLYAPPYSPNSFFIGQASANTAANFTSRRLLMPGAMEANEPEQYASVRLVSYPPGTSRPYLLSLALNSIGEPTVLVQNITSPGVLSTARKFTPNATLPVCQSGVNFAAEVTATTLIGLYETYPTQGVNVDLTEVNPVIHLDLTALRMQYFLTSDGNSTFSKMSLFFGQSPIGYIFAACSYYYSMLLLVTIHSSLSCLCSYRLSIDNTVSFVHQKLRRCRSIPSAL